MRDQGVETGSEVRSQKAGGKTYNIHFYNGGRAKRTVLKTLQKNEGETIRGEGGTLEKEVRWFFTDLLL